MKRNRRLQRRMVGEWWVLLRLNVYIAVGEGLNYILRL